MKLDDIKKIAALHNIKTAKARKSELVLAIQQAEGSQQCFESGRGASCGQDNCAWREDCV